MLLLPAIIIEGQTVDMSEIQYQRATQVLDNVVAEAAKLDLVVGVRVRAKSANIMWIQSPEKGRAAFSTLWEAIEKEDENPGFDREEARMVLLRYLYPRDSSFANELLHKLAEKSNAPSDAPFSFETVSGKNVETNRLARLAFRLLDTDTTLAAGVLEQSLARNTAPQAILVMAKLRELDPLLADYVARRALQNIANQPPTIAVVGVTHLITYIFPLTPSPAPSIAVEQADEILRAQFMDIGYRILKASVSESDESLKEKYRMSSQALEFRTYSQGFLSATLAALSTHYAPYLTPELMVMRDRLFSKIPAQMVQGANMQASVIKSTTEHQDGSDSSDGITPAIANGDFVRARSLIEKLKDERLKKIYAQQLASAEFKSFLPSDLESARKVARSVEDSSLKMQMFGQLAKAAHRKGDVVSSAETLREALKMPVDPDYKGAHARALFVLATESTYFAGPESLVVLRAAVKLLNELGDVEKGKPNTPRQSLANSIVAFTDSNELMTAFARLARNYFEETLQIAEDIENKAVRYQASLSSIERVLRTRTAVPSPKPKPGSNQQ